MKYNYYIEVTPTQEGEFFCYVLGQKIPHYYIGPEMKFGHPGPVFLYRLEMSQDEELRMKLSLQTKSYSMFRKEPIMES